MSADYSWPADAADRIRAALAATREKDQAERLARLLGTKEGS